MADSNIAGLPAGAAITDTDLIASSDTGSGTLVKKTGAQFDTYFQEMLAALPTVDPNMLGMLWNNGGLIAISQPFTRELAGNTGHYALAGTTAELSPGYSAESIQFFQRIVALPDATRQGLYRDLIDGLVLDGVWAKLDVLYILAAQGMGNASLVNLIGPTYQAQFLALGGPTMTFTPDRGYSNAGSGDLSSVDSGFIPASSTGNYQQNDAMVSAWQVGSTLEDAPIVNELANDNGTAIFSKGTNGQNIFTVNVAAGGGSYTRTAVAGSPAGFWLAQRTGSTASAIYQNNSLLASAAFVSDPNNTGHIVISPALNTAAAFAVGASLNSTLRTALYTRLNTYMVAVGAA